MVHSTAANLQCTYLQRPSPTTALRYPFFEAAWSLWYSCSFATLHRETRWPRNCITTSQCVHNSPFPGITNKRGNSDFPAAWWPVTRCHNVQVFVLVTANCLLLMFHSWLRRKSAWTGKVDAVSHSTYSNLQNCFRTHSLERMAPLCIKWPMSIRGRGQYWSRVQLKCDGTR